MAILIAAPSIAAQKSSLLDGVRSKKFGTAPAQIFRGIDENGDGKITEDELRLHRVGLFVEADRNNDLALTKDELPLMKDSVFAEMDEDGDGKISGFEFHQAAVLRFENMDKNQDGSISLEELTEFLNSISTRKR